MKCTFLGLGVMGFPMAGHLKADGHEVVVYNRTAATAERWQAKYGGETATTPAEAVKAADIVFACVGADKDVEAVTIGSDGAFSAMESGSIFVDHTTVSADLARRLETVGKDKGIGVLDAPVSGGQAGAESGALTIMVGGQVDMFEKAEPVMQAYAKQIGHMGPAGAGQTAKMVNQICIAGLVQGLAEGIHFAKSAGLNVDTLVDVISKGAAGSWQMENRASTMAKGEFDFGFAVDWMRKDLGIVLDEANRLGISLPITALVDQFYADVQAMGGNRQDTSSLIRRFQG